ncbi:MAG: DUF3857 domain-containing transglutaminase family protein [Bacteroidota bacterium]
MKKILLILSGVVFQIATLAGDPKYPVSEIPENMKKGMYAVIREQERRFEINSINSSSLFERIVITIFNDKAKEHAEFAAFYDKLSSVKSFKGTAYDAAGNVIKKLKQSEIYDQSVYQGGTLFSDDRFKAASLRQGSYPYTVEFEVETSYKRLYETPDFEMYNDDEISIQRQKFVLIHPKELAPRYSLFKIGEPKKNIINGKESLEWSFENVIPEKFEPFSPDTQHFIPHIVTAPADFEYDGYKGSMKTWNDYGRWIGKLNKGRSALPEATKQKIKQLIANESTTDEKVKAIYNYLQNKTRYVGIQLGIGGYQPFEASTVDQTGYGDCKALSNYMVSMLEVAGIKSHYVLIRAGKNEPQMQADFPSSQFNHVIVAVPNDKDTIWLECTNQTNPFGYMGSFTGDRKALLITDDGAKVVNTISYPAEQNIQSRTADVYLESSGNGKAKVSTTYAGLQYENGSLNHILGNQFDEQKKWVEENTGIASFDVNSFSISDKKDKVPSATVKLDLTLKRLASVSGKRLFITPNLMNRSTYIPPKVESRKNKVVRNLAYIDLDTIRYHLPEEIYPEFLPEPTKISSRFGEYESSFKIDQGRLLYIRRVKMNKGEFPPESYNELIEFYRNINKADNNKLVFMSKT